MTKKIFITGCARSGTTLLNRLFYAFDNAEILTNEIELDKFIGLDSKKDFLIAKRHPVSVFSVPLKEDQFHDQIKMIQTYNIFIVNIIRDGRDVVHKDIEGSPDVKPDRWIGCMKHTLKYIEYVSVNIKYEELIYNPNSVQEIIAKKLGLNKVHKFNDYPEFVPDDVFKEWELAHLRNYSKRSIETKSIGHNKDEYKRRCKSQKEQDEFEQMIESYQNLISR